MKMTGEKSECCKTPSRSLVFIKQIQSRYKM